MELSLSGRYHKGAFITKASSTNIATIARLTTNILVRIVHNNQAATPKAAKVMGPLVRYNMPAIILTAPIFEAQNTAQLLVELECLFR